MSLHHFHYNSFYYSNLCHVCKKSNGNLKRCSSCKSVAYCSKDHQIQDWKLHKELCKAITKIDRELKFPISDTFEEHKRYNITKSLLMHKELSRELYPFETQIWMFPRVCAVCFSKNVTYDCPSCLNISYCSDLHKNIHKEQHSKFCDILKLCMKRDLFFFCNKFKPTDVNVHDFAPDLKTLPNSLTKLIVMYDTEDMPEHLFSDDMMRFISKSDLIAPAATILYGLENSGLLKDRLLDKSDLTVHIVGAEATEMSWRWKLIAELLFHWIIDLKILNFCVVGPQLNHIGLTEILANELCDSCREKQPITKIFFHCELYHDVAASMSKPDLVVAFNSGLHEIGDNAWYESIDCLTMFADIPLLLTAYTSNEIKQDVCTVQTRSSRGVRIILEPRRNPFCNMTPIRNWETENSPVFYVNGFVAILQSE